MLLMVLWVMESGATSETKPMGGFYNTCGRNLWKVIFPSFEVWFQLPSPCWWDWVTLLWMRVEPGLCILFPYFLEEANTSWIKLVDPSREAATCDMLVLNCKDKASTDSCGDAGEEFTCEMSSIVSTGHVHTVCLLHQTEIKAKVRRTVSKH